MKTAFRPSKLAVQGDGWNVAMPTLECRYCKALAMQKNDGRPYRWHPRTSVAPRVCVRCKRPNWSEAKHGPHTPGYKPAEPLKF
jgi:hypothetical protein